MFVCVSKYWAIFTKVLTVQPAKVCELILLANLCVLILPANLRVLYMCACVCLCRVLVYMSYTTEYLILLANVDSINVLFC